MLNDAAWGAFLAALDPIPEEAAQVYEALRRHLSTFFRLAGFDDSETLVDEVFNRAARRFGETPVKNVRAYIQGIARKVVSENWNERRRTVQLGADGTRVPASRAHAKDNEASEAELACLDEALAQLSEPDRYLVLEYYRFDKRLKIEHRSQLGIEFDMSKTALRVRMQRLRGHLEKAITRCLDRLTEPL